MFLPQPSPDSKEPEVAVNIVDIVFIALILLSVGYYLLSTHYSIVFFTEKKKQFPQSSAAQLPPVSIIKPITRAEVGHIINFISFLKQDYPFFEVVFSFSKGDDIVIPALENLKDRFPTRNIRWVLTDENWGPNYKVGNLQAAIREAKYDIVIMSDSDMSVRPDYLRTVVGSLQQDGVGIVTCLYRGVQICNYPQALHGLTIQSDFIPNVIMGYKIEGISYAFGATICTSKTILNKLGGLDQIKEYLADDYQIGQLVHQNGYEVKLSEYLVDHVSAPERFWDYFSHQLRWAITQRVSRPWGYLASVITQGVALSALFMIIKGFSPLAAMLFGSTLTVRLACFNLLNRSVIRNTELVRYIWLIPLKDLLNSFIWLLSLFINEVRWKHRKFRVLKGGKMYELEAGGAPRG